MLTLLAHVPLPALDFPRLIPPLGGTFSLTPSLLTGVETGDEDDDEAEEDEEEEELEQFGECLAGRAARGMLLSGAAAAAADGGGSPSDNGEPSLATVPTAPRGL